MVYKAEDEALLKSALLMLQEKQLSSLPQDEELDEIIFTENFENKMQKLINSQKKPYYIIVNTVGKRVACIIVAVLISFTAMMSVDAIREPFIRYVIEVFEKYSAVYFKENSQITPETFETYAPEYIPEGYTEVKKEGSAEFMYNYITYFDERGNNIEFQQDIATDHISINTENTTIEKIYINSFEAIYWENLGERLILFSDGTYSFYVSCVEEKTSKEEFIKIAESIKTEKK